MSRRLSASAATLLLMIAWEIRGRPQGAAARAAAGTDGSVVDVAACASCHQREHETWKSGRHSRVVQPAITDSIKGDFSKRGVTLRRSPYRFRVEGGRFFITESYLTGKPQEHRVDYTLGSRRVQHYLTTLADGRIILLPPSWDVQRQEWFHNWRSCGRTRTATRSSSNGTRAVSAVM